MGTLPGPGTPEIRHPLDRAPPGSCTPRTRHPPGPGTPLGLDTPQADSPQFPPWLWAWTRSPSTSPLAMGLDQILLHFPLRCVSWRPAARRVGGLTAMHAGMAPQFGQTHACKHFLPCPKLRFRAAIIVGKYDAIREINLCDSKYPLLPGNIAIWATA